MERQTGSTSLFIHWMDIDQWHNRFQNANKTSWKRNEMEASGNGKQSIIQIILSIGAAIRRINWEALCTLQQRDFFSRKDSSKHTLFIVHCRPIAERWEQIPEIACLSSFLFFENISEAEGCLFSKCWRCFSSFAWGEILYWTSGLKKTKRNWILAWSLPF